MLATASDSWMFDMFALAEATRGHPLSTLGYFLCECESAQSAHCTSKQIARHRGAMGLYKFKCGAGDGKDLERLATRGQRQGFCVELHAHAPLMFVWDVCEWLGKRCLLLIRGCAKCKIMFPAVAHETRLVSTLRLSPTMLARFLRNIEAGYKPHPYHNATHAADVLQALHSECQRPTRCAVLL